MLEAIYWTDAYNTTLCYSTILSLPVAQLVKSLPFSLFPFVFLSPFSSLPPFSSFARDIRSRKHGLKVHRSPAELQIYWL